MAPDGLSGSFIENGTIQYGALFGSLLGAAWLVLVGGFIRIQNAIVTIQVRILEVAQSQIVRVIDAVLGGGASLARASWAAAYQSAVETAPLLAPVTLFVELAIVWAIFSAVAKRQELV